MRKLALAIVLALGVPLAAPAQIDPGNPLDKHTYRTHEDRAVQHLGRGLKAKRKAEKATDPAEKQKHYEAAKTELLASIEHGPSFANFLAMGQVYLGLQDHKLALNYCSEASQAKPKDKAAQECAAAAKAALEAEGIKAQVQ